MPVDSWLPAEAVVLASDRDVPLGPWRSADVAILPLRYRAAAALDTASGWRRELTVPGDPEASDSVGLWLRESWRARFWRVGPESPATGDRLLPGRF